MCFRWSTIQCFHSPMKHEWREQCDLLSSRWENLHFQEGNKTIQTLFLYGLSLSLSLFFLRLKSRKNNSFIKEIKHALCAFIAWWKPWQRLWALSSCIALVLTRLWKHGENVLFLITYQTLWDFPLHIFKQFPSCNLIPIDRDRFTGIGCKHSSAHSVFIRFLVVMSEW